MPSVTLYGREGCHLCDVARATIMAVRERHPFAFTEVDIDRSDALIRDFGYRIPVVEVDGAEVFEIDVPADAFEALVRGR
ncbi:MAG: glutaredoxin family protein [Actinomycetota bacterium]